MPNSRTRADWTLCDAIIWINDRSEDRLNDPTFCLPNLAASSVYRDHGNSVAWLGAAKALLAALKAGQLRARLLTSNYLDSPIAAGHWNAKRISYFDRSDPAIVLSATKVQEIFPNSDSRNGPKHENLSPKAPPPLSKTNLEAWWNGLSPEDRLKPQGQLLTMCHTAHPNNSIARQRIRNLDPGRKRGPKPFRQNRPA